MGWKIMKVYLKYTEYSIDESNESDFSEEYTTLSVDGLYKEKPSCGYYETFEIDDKKRGTKLYIVVVRYSTGSTFGQSNGCSYFEGIYNTAEEAGAISDSIYKNKYLGYRPWHGYFERLEDVEIHERIIS